MTMWRCSLLCSVLLNVLATHLGHVEGASGKFSENCDPNAMSPCLANMECIIRGCDGYICVCDEGYMPSEDYSKCITISELKKPCTNASRCRGIRTRCSDDHVCECLSGYVLADTMSPFRQCKQQPLSFNHSFSLLGERCDGVRVFCERQETRCNGTHCVCDENFRIATVEEINAYPFNELQCVQSSFKLNSAVPADQCPVAVLPTVPEISTAQVTDTQPLHTISGLTSSTSLSSTSETNPLPVFTPFPSSFTQTVSSQSLESLSNMSTISEYTLVSENTLDKLSVTPVTTLYPSYINSDISTSSVITGYLTSVHTFLSLEFHYSSPVSPESVSVTQTDFLSFATQDLPETISHNSQSMESSELYVGEPASNSIFSSYDTDVHGLLTDSYSGTESLTQPNHFVTDSQPKWTETIIASKSMEMAETRKVITSSLLPSSSLSFTLSSSSVVRDNEVSTHTFTTLVPTISSSSGFSTNSRTTDMLHPTSAHPVHAGDNCTMPDKCFQHSVCKYRCGRWACHCSVGYIQTDDRLNCLPIVSLGQSCSIDKQCIGPNTKCHHNICACVSGYEITKDRKRCRRRSSWFVFFPLLHETCGGFLTECYNKFEQICSGSKCKCRSGLREVTLNDSVINHKSYSQCRNSSFPEGYVDYDPCSGPTHESDPSYGEGNRKVRVMIAAIIGGVLGVILLIVIVITIFCFVRRKMRSKKRDMTKDNVSDTSFDRRSSGKYSFRLPRPFAFHTGEKDWEAEHLSVHNSEFEPVTDSEELSDAETKDSGNSQMNGTFTNPALQDDNIESIEMESKNIDR